VSAMGSLLTFAESAPEHALERRSVRPLLTHRVCWESPLSERSSASAHRPLTFGATGFHCSQEGGGSSASRVPNGVALPVYLSNTRDVRRLIRCDFFWTSAR